MPNRVSPTDQIRAEIDALFDGSRELGEVIEDVARLGARLIIQTAVEAEVEGYSWAGPGTSARPPRPMPGPGCATGTARRRLRRRPGRSPWPAEAARHH